MKPEQQRIAIAEACGIKWVEAGEIRLVNAYESWPGHWASESTVRRRINGNIVGCPVGLPDYLNDLNAMHEAIQQFRYPEGGTLWAKNHGHLRGIVERDRQHSKDSVSFEWEVANASAAQRAEAFLRTLDLWKESL